MAHAWIRSDTATDPSHGGGATSPGWMVRELTAQTEYFGAASLVRAGTTKDGSLKDSWAVIGSDSVLVNGARMLLGIRVLADRDEIRIDRAHLCYFSTERLATIEPFPGTNRATHCARCKQTVDKGQLAVRCPGCGIWYHQIGSDPSKEGDLPCWAYGDRCASCLQPNELAAGYRWSPEGLEDL